MGGVKRKIRIEKIENQDSRAVAFSKRHRGLYSKAAELCLSSDAQIAIIATPVSSNSNVSFYTFGHSSVDSVVSAFLANQRPRDERLGFWWEDESLAKSENLEELRDAIDSMSTMLQDLKEVKKRRDCEGVTTKKGVLDVTHQKQTLNPQQCSAGICIQDDITVNFEGFQKNTEEQTIAVSDNSNNSGLLGTFDGCNQELDLDQIFDSVTNSEFLSLNLEMCDVSIVKTNQNMFYDLDAGENRELMIHRDLEEHQMLAVSDSNNSNALLGQVGGCNQELKFDQFFDHVTNSEFLSMNLEMSDVSMVKTSQNMFSDSEAGDSRESVIRRDLDEHQMIAVSDNNNNNALLGSVNFDQIIDLEDETKSEGLLINDVSMATTYQNPRSDSEVVEDGELVALRNLYDDSSRLSDLDADQILAISDDNNVLPGNLSWFNQELDLDHVTDCETNLEMDDVSMATTKQNMCSGSETVEEERLVIHRDLDEGNLCSSDIFNELTSIVAL